MHMLTILNIFQVIFLTVKHKLPTRRVLSDYAGDGGIRIMANILQDGRVCPFDRFSGLENILGRYGNELESITLVIDLNRSRTQTGCVHHRLPAYTSHASHSRPNGMFTSPCLLK